jgi:hypothetical protein
MARFIDFQTNFSTGELDPLLRGRVDLQQYNNALAKATNVIVQPQGGVKRRPGCRHITELPNSGNESVGNGVRLVPFEFSVDDSYMLVFVHQRMYVIKDRTLITNINASGNDYLTISSLTSSMLNGLSWTQSADTMIVVHPDLPPITIVRGANDASWTATAITFDSVPRYAFTLSATNPAGTLTPSAVAGNITLTASSSVFSAGNVGQYINASPQGRARIVGYTSGTVVTAVTEYPFFSTAAIANGNWELETGYEDVWSVTRGWPRTVTFHEGRLYFGGSKSRPSTIWGSKIGLFFSFAPEENLDDDAIEATLDTNQLNVIIDIVSGRDFQVFTTGGEFFVPQAGTEPITPTTFTFKAVSRNGMRPNTRVESLESGSVFIQRQGKSLNEFLFSDTQLTYITQRISLLSGHLLKEPKRMGLLRSTENDQADLLFIVNDSDGGMVCYSILRNQNIVAPSEFITDGNFLDVAIDVTDVYTVTKRTFDGTDKYFLEVLCYQCFTDCAFVGGAASKATGLPHGNTDVNVITDGVPQSNETVISGNVDFDRASIESYEVGLPYDVLVQTMPAELNLQTGTRTGFKKRITQVNAVVYETQHLNINDQIVPFRNFDNPVLDDPVPTFTGIKRLDGVLGYSREAAITVKQTLPLKMTLLSLEYKLAVHQGT